MLNLIKNELFKIFHKKSTIILLTIMALFIVLTNAIYKSVDTTIYYYYGDDIEYAKDYVNNYVPGKYDRDEYIYYLAVVDASKELENYEVDSWQYKAIMNYYRSAAMDYYNYKVINNDDNFELKMVMQNILDKIKTGDWEYFIREDIHSEEETLSNLQAQLNNPNISNKEKSTLATEIATYQERIKLLNYRLSENIPYQNDYLNDALSEMNNNIYDYIEYTTNNDSKFEGGYGEYLKNKYIVDEKQDILEFQTSRMMLINFFDEYYFLILVFIVMIAGGIISDEFNKGTIKSLLILPYSRTKILASKFISVVIMLLFAIIYMLLLQFIVGGIFFGFSSLAVPYVVYNYATHSIEVVNLFKYIILTTIAYLPKLLLLGTLAFALSTIIGNTAFAIAITFCGAIGEEIVNIIALNYKVKILNFFVTTNWNFPERLFGGKPTFDIALPQSIIVCLVYFLIMLIVALIVFKKKDIKNI